MAVEIGVGLEVDNVNDIRRLSDEMERLERSAETLAPAVADADRRLSLIGRNRQELGVIAAQLRGMASEAKQFNNALASGDATRATASLRAYQQQVAKLSAALRSLDRSGSRAIASDPASGRVVESVRRLSSQVNRLERDFVTQGQQLSQAETRTRRRAVAAATTSPDERAAQQRQQQVRVLNRQLEQLQGAVETQLPRGLDQQIRRLANVLNTSARTRGRLANQPGSSFFNRTRLRAIERSALRQQRQIGGADTDPFLQQIGSIRRDLTNPEASVRLSQDRIRALQSQIRRFQSETVAGATSSVNRLSRAMARIGPSGARAFRRVSAAARPASRSVDRMTMLFRRLHRVYLGLFIVQQGVDFAQGFTHAADEVTRLSNLMRALGGGAAEVSQHMRAVRDIALDTFTPLEGAGTLYARILRSNDRLGLSLDDVRSVTEAFQQSLALSGADARETLAASVQFGQALSSGRLAGDEFKSLSESAPVFLQALRDAYNEINDTNISLKDFRDLGAESKLTSEVLLDLTLRVVPRLNRQFSTFSRTFQHAFDVVGTGFSFFANALGESLDRTFGIRDALIDVGRSLTTQFGPGGFGFAGIDAGEVIASVGNAIREFLHSVLDRVQVFITSLDFDSLIGDAGGALGRFVESTLGFLDRTFEIVLSLVSRIDTSAIEGFFDSFNDILEGIINPGGDLGGLSDLQQSIVFIGRRMLALFLSFWQGVLTTLATAFSPVAATIANFFIDLFNDINARIRDAIGLTVDASLTGAVSEAISRADAQRGAGDLAGADTTLADAIENLDRQTPSFLESPIQNVVLGEMRDELVGIRSALQAQQQAAEDAANIRRGVSADQDSQALVANRAQFVAAEQAANQLAFGDDARQALESIARFDLERRDERLQQLDQQATPQSLSDIPRSIRAELSSLPEVFSADLQTLSDTLAFLRDPTGGELVGPTNDMLQEVVQQNTVLDRVAALLELLVQARERGVPGLDSIIGSVEQSVDSLQRVARQTGAPSAVDALPARLGESLAEMLVFQGAPSTDDRSQAADRLDAEAQRLRGATDEAIAQATIGVQGLGPPQPVERVASDALSDFAEEAATEIGALVDLLNADISAYPGAERKRDNAELEAAFRQSNRQFESALGRTVRGTPVQGAPNPEEQPLPQRPNLFERLFEGIGSDVFNAAGEADISGQFRSGLKGALNNSLNTGDFDDFGQNVLFALQRSLNDAFAENIIDNIFEPLFDRLRGALTRAAEPEQSALDPEDERVAALENAGRLDEFIDRRDVEAVRDEYVTAVEGLDEAFEAGEITPQQRAEGRDQAQRRAQGQLGALEAAASAARAGRADEALAAEVPEEATVVDEFRGVGASVVTGFESFISGIRDGVANLFDNTGISSLIDLVVGGFQSLFDGIASLFSGQGGGAGGALAGITGFLGGLLPFQEGGFVPGPPGRPVPILAHAGELVLNQSQQAAIGRSGGATVNNTNNISGNVDRPTREFLSRNSAELAYMVRRESRYL